MPRKRALAETDANVDCVPAPKKGKSNAKGDKHSPAEDAFAQLAPTKSDAPPLKEDGTVLANAPDNTWICICPTKTSLIRHNESENDDRDEKYDCGCGSKCLVMQLASANPGHKWVMTKKGYQLAMEWGMQQELRCQDNFDMHILNRWNGYGISEVIENIFLAYAKVTKSISTKIKAPDLDSFLSVWSHVESMALFLSRDIVEMRGIESSDNAKRIMLIGSMLLHALDLLWTTNCRRQGFPKLFQNDSPDLPNVALILSLFLQFAENWKGTCRLNEDGWKYIVVDRADKQGVIIRGLSGIESLVENIRTENKKMLDEHEGHKRSISKEDYTQEMVEEMDNLMACYKRQDLCGVITMEKLRQGTRRRWSMPLNPKTWSFSNSAFFLELDFYKSAQAVKIGPTGPQYGGKIGGKFYDLTAQRNKGSHIRGYRLSDRI